VIILGSNLEELRRRLSDIDGLIRTGSAGVSRKAPPSIAGIFLQQEVKAIPMLSMSRIKSSSSLSTQRSGSEAGVYEENFLLEWLTRVKTITTHQKT